MSYRQVLPAAGGEAPARRRRRQPLRGAAFSAGRIAPLLGLPAAWPGSLCHSPPGARLPRHLLLSAAAALVLLLLLVVPASSQAAFGISEPDVFFGEESGEAATLAGAHPFAMQTSFKLNTTTEGGSEIPDGSLRDLEVTLPEGMAGIPTAVPQCPGADFATLNEEFEPPPPSCSNDSAIGYVTVGATFNPVPAGGLEYGIAPLYNLAPAPGSVAKFGFVFLKVPVTIDVHLSAQAPYRVIATLHHAAQPLLLYASSVTVWGDPAAAAHDPYRGTCLEDIEDDGTLVSRGNCPFDPLTPHSAFLTLPRACQGPLATAFDADTWEEPGVQFHASSLTHEEGGEPAGFEDCGALGFEPSLTLSSSASQAESPAGLGVGVHFAAGEGLTDPAQRANADLRKVVARLPGGVTLNPSAGDGLQGCTTAQYDAEALSTPPGAGCPQAAKIGTLTATSPLIGESLQGAIFAAAPDDPATATPGQENPFDSFLAVYLVLRNQNLGVIVKQAGKVEADPLTGQLTGTFDDAPQLPISAIETHFRSGPRAPLATPPGCGDFAAQALQSSWTGTEVLTTANLEVTQGPGGGPCPTGPGPLAPGFEAGTQGNAAGSYSPLTFGLSRRDGEADITRVSLALPQGLTGKLAGIERCPDAAIAAAEGKSGRSEQASPSCPAASVIGHVLAGAGAGPALLYVPGTAYLAGPYLGAPFSVAVITPGVAGPFDLGNVVVREPLRIDPATALVSVDGSAGAPLPRILKGIPVRLREIRISADRPGFILNPTSCEPKQITATLAGAGPSLSDQSPLSAQIPTRFQASGCKGLGFKPKLSLRLHGATKRAGHAALRAVLTTRAGDANLARATTILPPSQFIDPLHISNPCTRVQFDAGKCPAASVIGHARAISPLLAKPLEGPIYFRSNGGARELPDIVADLGGEVHITTVGFVDSVPVKGTELTKLRTTFATVPDAPLTKVILSFAGGKKHGLLENNRNLCAAKQRAAVKLTAQNNRRRSFSEVIKTSCGGQGAKGKRGGR